MKNKIKTLIGIVIVILVAVMITNVIGSHEKKELSGNLKIVVNSSNYKYINSAAEQFKEKHHKVKITIEEVADKDYYNHIINQYKNGNKQNVAVMSNEDVKKMVHKEKILPIEVEGIIDTYNGNFGKARLNEVSIDGKYYSIPFSSKPIGLFLRNDLLGKYGYNDTDINTWQDIMSVGKGIYKKSKGEVKLLDGVGNSYDMIVSLLVMENLNAGYDSKETVKNTKNMIESLIKENILTTNLYEGFAGQINSINGVRAIEALKVPCQWEVGNPPALMQGENKFYEAGGDDLVILSEKNVELSKAFVSFLSNNTKLSLEYTKSTNLFSSYMYTYKSVEIEDKINNFVGKSPLVVLSNIAMKAPSIQNYDEYLKIKKQVLEDNIIN